MWRFLGVARVGSRMCYVFKETRRAEGGIAVVSIESYWSPS